MEDCNFRVNTGDVSFYFYANFTVSSKKRNFEYQPYKFSAPDNSTAPVFAQSFTCYIF